MTTTETTTRPLSPRMREALIARLLVRGQTAHALVRRGLATITGRPSVLGYSIELTEAGIAARNAMTDPLIPGVRVRSTLTGFVGRVVRVTIGQWSDNVELRWDHADVDTAASPAYLEVIEVEPAPVAKHTSADCRAAGITYCYACNTEAAESEIEQQDDPAREDPPMSTDRIAEAARILAPNLATRYVVRHLPNGTYVVVDTHHDSAPASTTTGNLDEAEGWRQRRQLSWAGELVESVLTHV